MTDAGLTLKPWQVDPGGAPPASAPRERARFLLRYAILAPSSHNSQPWRLRIDGDAVVLRPEADRWLRVADADRRELHLSLGCAVENLVVACRRFGHDPAVELAPDADGEPVARVVPGGVVHEVGARDHRLFEAITRRRTSHHDFTERALDASLEEEFAAAAAVREVRLIRIPGGETRAALADLQREADARQMADPDYREELGRWIGSGALGDGWPKARIAQWVVTHFDLGAREGKDNARDLSEAPFVGVIVTDSDDPIARVRAGQGWARMALTAAAADVATHPLSQILEVPELRDELGRLLELDGLLPQHLFRAGHAETHGEHTPRWPLERFLKE